MTDYIDAGREYTSDDLSELAVGLMKTYQEHGLDWTDAAPAHRELRDRIIAEEDGMTGQEVQREAARYMQEEAAGAQYDDETRENVKAFCAAVLPEDEREEWSDLDE